MWSKLIRKNSDEFALGVDFQNYNRIIHSVAVL